MSKATAPLVPSSMIRPFTDAIIGTGIDVQGLLENVQIPLFALDAQVIPISAQSWYSLANRAAELLDDPYFGYRVGSETAFNNLPNLQSHTRTKQPLGSILYGLIEDAGKATSHAKYSLIVESDRTILRQRRLFQPTEPPVQIDAFGVGFMVQIYKFAVGSRWNPNEITMTVCDPAAVPKNALYPSSLRQADIAGNEHVFPTQWLHANSLELPTYGGAQALDIGLIETIRVLLKLNLEDPTLTCDKLGQVCGCSARTLRRVMADHNTTFLRELARVRQAAAEDALKNTSQSIKEIGRSIGFEHQRSFTRSFKKWTGQTPANYRIAVRRSVR